MLSQVVETKKLSSSKITRLTEMAVELIEVSILVHADCPEGERRAGDMQRRTSFRSPPALRARETPVLPSQTTSSRQTGWLTSGLDLRVLLLGWSSLTPTSSRRCIGCTGHCPRARRRRSTRSTALTQSRVPAGQRSSGGSERGSKRRARLQASSSRLRACSTG